MLQHVMEACFNAAVYLNNWTSRKMFVDVAVLVPLGDPIVDRIAKEVAVIEGSENDVLSRYMKLSNSDYVCRITADCPLIPPFIISKIITLAVMNRYDYVSNVDERFRTTVDGWDCEVISQRALAYLNEYALLKEDREHVTTFLRRSPPPWLIQGASVNFLDLSDYPKLSVDTEEDLERVRLEYKKIETARSLAEKACGRKAVHRS